MLSREDIAILRPLAKQLHDLAELPEQEEKRELWRRHTSLKGERPMVFVHPDGAWAELLPWDSLTCQTSFGKELEYLLRQRLIRARYLPDDVPVEGDLPVKKVFSNSMWGVEPKRVQSSATAGAWHHVPIIDSPEDWKKLSMPVILPDEAATERRLDAAQEALGDLLQVSLVGETNFSFHLMHWYCDYRGLDNMMYDLIDEPEMVHDVMRFFTEGCKSLLRQYEEYNLLSLNNDGTFHYTGGIGYTHSLPAEGFDPERVRLCDLWGAAEAQEFSSISPAMHEEFVLSYEREILEPFGLNGYGCCDDLSQKLDNVLKIRNLRRVAVCPWADIANFTPRLGKDYIMTWKPQPAYLATDPMDEDSIRAELAAGVRKAHGGILELILRDTHTCRNEPERFTRWIALAREAIRENW